MNTSTRRSLIASGAFVGSRIAGAVSFALETIRHEIASAPMVALTYVRSRWRLFSEDLRPYLRDTVQKRKLHREAWLDELESRELELRAVPMTAAAAAREAREWKARLVATAARYDAMREELRSLREFNLVQIPCDRNGAPREGTGLPLPRPVSRAQEFSAGLSLVNESLEPRIRHIENASPARRRRRSQTA
jgi:hypothetical protein